MLYGKLNYLIVAFALVKIKHSKHMNTDICKWAKLLTYENGNKTSFNYLINLSTSIKFSSLFESFSSVERRTDVSKTFRDCFPFPFFDFTIEKPSLSIELLNKKSKDLSYKTVTTQDTIFVSFVLKVNAIYPIPPVNF